MYLKVLEPAAAAEAGLGLLPTPPAPAAPPFPAYFFILSTSKS